MLKRTALVLTLAAALVAAAPTAPASPAAADTGSGPAWGHYMMGNSTAHSIVTTMACGLTGLGLALAGVGAFVFGAACGLTSAA